MFQMKVIDLNYTYIKKIYKSYTIVIMSLFCHCLGVKIVSS
jgi:hypothetical protein